MYAFLIVIHVIASLILIAVILLQAGRGGGLSETFGGSSTQTIFGTSAATFLKKATSVTAIAFLLTSLLLAVYTGKRSRSLMEGVRIAPMPIQQEQSPTQATTEKAPESAAEQNDKADKK